jgi:RNA polymerase sigma-70 factor (ECF subfamily)
VDVDRTLVERAQRGDRDAYAQVAIGSSDRLYAIALRVLRDGEAASDALQAALVQIWRDLPSLRDADRFDAWSYRVVLNCCRAHHRRSRRVIPTIDLSPDDAMVADSQTTIATRDELERAFRALSDDQRAVLVLLYYRDLSIGEIAATLGISTGTVKSRLHYARNAMRAAIDAHGRPTEREGRPT